MTDLKEVIEDGEQQQNADLVIEVQDVEQDNVQANQHLDIGAGLLNAAPLSPAAPRGDASVARPMGIGIDSSPMKSTDGGKTPGI